MSISLLDEIPRQQGYSGDLNEADNSWVVRKTEEIFDQYATQNPLTPEDGLIVASTSSSAPITGQASVLTSAPQTRSSSRAVKPKNMGDDFVVEDPRKDKRRWDSSKNQGHHQGRQLEG